jgi:hypothetical protein
MKTHIYQKSIGSQLLSLFFSLLISAFFFTLILVIRLPLFKTIDVYVRNSFTTFIPLTGGMLYLTSLLKGDKGRLVRLITVVCLFGFALSGLWANVATENNSFGGLLPRSDPSAYLTDSLRILNGFKSSYTSSRPINQAFIALLLFLTRINLQTSLAIIVFLAAIASYFVYEFVLEKFGVFPSIIFFLLIFFYFRPTSGKFINESISYILGIFGFFSFFLFLSKQKNLYYFLGLICLTLSLNIRPGPLFILPFAVLLLPDYRKADRKKILYYFGGGVLTIIICFLWQNLFTLLFIKSGAIPFANYSYVLYGISQGGTGWQSIRMDYPDFFNVPKIPLSDLDRFYNPDTIKWIFSLALNNIKNDPIKLLSGIARQYPLIFDIKHKMGLFSFFYYENITISNLSQYFLFFLSFFGLLNLIKKSIESVNKLIIVFVIGILFSIPFLPFSDQYQMRTYSGAIAFIALLPTVGLKYLINYFAKSKNNKFASDNQKRQIRNQITPIGILIIAILFFVCVLPIIMIFVVSPSKTNINPCENGYEQALIRFGKGSTVNVYPAYSKFLDWLPNVHREKFITSIHLYPYDEFVKSLEILDPPYSLTSTLDLLTEYGMIMIINRDLNDLQPGLYSLCGKWQTGDWNNMSPRFFYVKSITTI